VLQYCELDPQVRGYGIDARCASIAQVGEVIVGRPQA
jgi:hypothetical protein